MELECILVPYYGLTYIPTLLPLMGLADGVESILVPCYGWTYVPSMLNLTVLTNGVESILEPCYGWTYIPSKLPMMEFYRWSYVDPCTLLWVDVRSQIDAPDRAYRWS